VQEWDTEHLSGILTKHQENGGSGYIIHEVGEKSPQEKAAELAAEAAAAAAAAADDVSPSPGPGPSAGPSPGPGGDEAPAPAPAASLLEKSAHRQRLTSRRPPGAARGAPRMFQAAADGPS